MAEAVSKGSIITTSQSKVGQVEYVRTAIGIKKRNASSPPKADLSPSSMAEFEWVDKTTPIAE